MRGLYISHLRPALSNSGGIPEPEAPAGGAQEPNEPNRRGAVRDDVTLRNRRHPCAAGPATVLTMKHHIDPPERREHHDWDASTQFVVDNFIQIDVAIGLAGTRGNSAETALDFQFSHVTTSIRGGIRGGGPFKADHIERLRISTYGEAERAALSEAFRRAADAIDHLSASLRHRR